MGVPFPSTEVRLVDREDHTRVIVPWPGELWPRGPQVFGRYWERAEETVKMLVEDGWLVTGDVVGMDDDGFFTIVDSVKELIVTGRSTPIRAKSRTPYGMFAALPTRRSWALPPPDGGDEAVAAVVLDEGAPFDEGAVRSACKERLAAYKLPRRVFVLENFPLSVIGKVLRRQVHDQLLARTSPEATR